MKKTAEPKLLPRHGAQEHSRTFNAGDQGAAISAPEFQDLAAVVWKYFEKEIRESMVEVQEAIHAEQSRKTVR